MKNNEKKLEDGATYEDIVASGYILPRKEKYTLKDFNNLLKKGWNQLDARWIILCSAAHHKVKTSSIFGTEKFLKECIEASEED